jgi:hypothetical protein
MEARKADLQTSATDVVAFGTKSDVEAIGRQDGMFGFDLKQVRSAEKISARLRGGRELDIRQCL